MARLIAALIRHGDYHQLQDVPSAHQPFPLNAQGEQQAREEASELRVQIERNDWQLEPVVDSSHMLRAWQTAGIFADILAGVTETDIRIEGHVALAERGLGCAANLTIAQIESVLQLDPRFAEPPDNWKADSHYRLPLQGAESLLDAGRRVAAHLQQNMSGLLEDDRDRLKLFVGHGAAFRHAAFHLGVLAFDDLRQLSMYHCQPVLLEYLPGGQWRHSGGEWKQRNRQSGYTD